jgi:hypothetical protein
VNLYRPLVSGWLWGGLLMFSCAYISPASGDQGASSMPSVEPATQASASSTSVPSLDSPRDFSFAQKAPAASAVPTFVPAFWASQSLARLMDQHDCPQQSSATEPLSLESGIRQVNRYKIAAQLFSCLEHWNQKAFDAQEQATLQALRSEFKLELVALQGYSTSDPVLVSANLPFDSLGSPLSSLTSNSATSLPINTAGYSQSVKIASQGRVAMGVHYTNQALGAPRNLLDINAEASLGKIGLFGRYNAALGPKFSQADRNLDGLLGDRSIQSWTAGIGIRDFMIRRSVLTVSVSKSIQPNNLFQAAQTNYSAFYQFPLTERLTLAPSIVIMTHSEKTDAAPDVQGALQASFSF